MLTTNTPEFREFDNASSKKQQLTTNFADNIRDSPQLVNFTEELSQNIALDDQSVVVNKVPLAYHRNYQCCMTNSTIHSSSTVACN